MNRLLRGAAYVAVAGGGLGLLGQLIELQACWHEARDHGRNPHVDCRVHRRHYERLPRLGGQFGRKIHRMSTTRISRQINASPARVYRALIDAEAVANWMVPAGMTSEVHEFETRVGGRFRISLTYEEPTGTGKSNAHTDTYHGRFVELVPNERVVEVMEFETSDPTMRGEMQVTFTLTAQDGGTELSAVHENVPPGGAPADNELGWRMSLDKLAALVGGNRKSEK